MFYIVCPDCSLKNTPFIHFLAKGWSPTRHELAGSHKVNTDRQTDCTVPDDYYFIWSPSGSYLTLGKALVIQLPSSFLKEHGNAALGPSAPVRIPPAEWIVSEKVN